MKIIADNPLVYKAGRKKYPKASKLDFYSIKVDNKTLIPNKDSDMYWTLEQILREAKCY